MPPSAANQVGRRPDRQAATVTTATKGIAKAIAVTTTAKAGFETAIALSQGYQAYEVQALDASGKVLGTSKAFGPKA